MNTGAFEGLALMLSNFLRIPPGTSVRKYYGGSSRSNGSRSLDPAAAALAANDFIKTIVDITSDDVCLTSTPFYLYNGDKLLNKNLESDYNELIAGINKIAKWAAVDLLQSGFSVYELRNREVKVPVYKDGVKGFRKVIRASFLPVLAPVEFYLSDDGEVRVYVEGKLKKNLLVFLNYTKESLSLPEEVGTMPSGCKFLISPTPVQLNHVSSVARDLSMVERAIYRYRVQLSRIVRFAEVEGGLTQGMENNELIIDNTSAAINANSMSLAMETSEEAMMFDDNIPIVPIRKGVGAIDIKSDIPDFSMIKELPDLDYTINKLFLSLRFPKSYSDFTEALSTTAVSLIRGDVRYSRMVDYCRSIMVDTVNTWIFGEDFVPSEAEVQIKISQLPSSEDDDVIEALGNYQDFVSNAFEFINASENLPDARARLDSLVILLGDTANIQAIQKWVVRMREYIEEKFKEDQGSETEEGGPSSEDSELESVSSSSELEEEEPAEPNISASTAADYGLPTVE